MKILDHRDIPEERLATTSEDGSRVYIFPAAVTGFFRTARNYVHLVLIAIFLFLPWVKIGGHQAILLDVQDRQFAFFGLTFWAHDTPILFFILLIAVILLAVVTAVWGRIWCGWGCPQTVFIDGVFRRIEQWVVGNHVQQIQLAKTPLSFRKLRIVSTKWILYILVSLIISHSFLAYFVGVDELGQIMTQHPFQNWVTFLVMLFITAVLAFDFGWFREQFCIIMCPYGRIQSVLMDEGSLAVLYDEKRGEPRGKISAQSTEKKGDCIDCYKCVSVCPTGIDIRRGVQMECIACTACIDVCNDVMSKVNRPPNLIRYSSVAELAGKNKKYFTPRVFAYLFILLIAISGLVYSVAQRETIDVSILRGHDEPFTIENVEAGLILNHFKLNIKNQEFLPTEVHYKLIWEPALNPPTQENSQALAPELIGPINPVILKPGELQRVPFFIRFHKSLADDNGQLKVKILFFEKTKSLFQVEKEVTLAAPIR